MSTQPPQGYQPRRSYGRAVRWILLASLTVVGAVGGLRLIGGVEGLNYAERKAEENVQEITGYRRQDNTSREFLLAGYTPSLGGRGPCSIRFRTYDVGDPTTYNGNPHMKPTGRELPVCYNGPREGADELVQRIESVLGFRDRHAWLRVRRLTKSELDAGKETPIKKLDGKDTLFIDDPDFLDVYNLAQRLVEPTRSGTGVIRPP
ncbi:MAG: hypothetical protein HYW26_02810 [Candidatus Aenigmarchaeota archaeon]|nr:hypothetical protein [Candidatus Aenigmarchaeota archaeon]